MSLMQIAKQNEDMPTRNAAMEYKENGKLESLSRTKDSLKSELDAFQTFAQVFNNLI